MLHLWSSRYPTDVEWFHWVFLHCVYRRMVLKVKCALLTRTLDEEKSSIVGQDYYFWGWVPMPSGISRGTIVGTWHDWHRIKRSLSAGMRRKGTPRSIAQVL